MPIQFYDPAMGGDVPRGFRPNTDFWERFVRRPSGSRLQYPGSLDPAVGGGEQFQNLFDILQQRFRSGETNPEQGYGPYQQAVNRLSPEQSHRLSSEWEGMQQGRQISGIYQNMLDQQRLAQGQLNQAGEYLQGNNQAVLGDYARARGEIEGVGRQARSDIGRRGAQQQASVMQGLQARGLGNTSILQNAQRGVAGDTERSYQGLNESLAGLRSGLAERTGQARFAGGQQMGDFMRYRTGLETGLLGQHGEFTRSRVEARDRNLLAQLQAAALAGGGGGGGNNSAILSSLIGAGGLIGAALI
jgi:hypothetical protein